MPKPIGRWAALIAATILAITIVLGWFSWWWMEEERLAYRLTKARAEIAAGRPVDARRWLATLSPRNAREPEAAYLMGVCEHEAGRFRAALDCWALIPPGSPLYPQAALARARTLVGDLGRYADAESALEAALPLSGSARQEVRHTLSQVYFDEGRRDAMRRLLRDGWSRASDPSAELRDLWMIDHAQTHFESVSRTVEEAARKAPDDDRVWLARANLDIQTGRFDEARSLLDRCLARRPDDPAVWRSRLDLARAQGDVVEARATLAHLPANTFTEADILSLRAWFAGRGRDADPDAERDALNSLVGIDPGETHALERLASLAHEAGDRERSQEFRRRKAEIDRTKERYRRLVEETVPTSGFAELAILAETLGRGIEAVGWWTLAVRSGSHVQPADEALARLRKKPASPSPPSGQSLADLLAPRAGVLPPAGSVAARDSIIPAFRDDSGHAGLRFVFENGRSRLRQLPETTAGGVGLLDYDGDGWLDVYLPQGGAFPPDTARPNRDRLFRNRGDGTFEDATGRSGIDELRGGYGHGIAVGDYDNDGDPDVFLTRWGSYALYRNRGDGTFEDLTDEAGLGGDRDWPTSAAFADLDNDGDLDLYVCHYLVWDAAHPTLCPGKAAPAGTTEADREYGYCMPNPFPSLPDHLFRNDGGRFVDVTAESGIVETNGRGLGVVAADVDGDGRVDLFVANDTTANALLHNLGGMKFEEVGVLNGVACNADGAFQAGMGTACGDLDGDGRPDLLVTNFYGESTTFFRNLGDGVFGDQTASVGLAAASRFLLGFGIALFDANNDGRLDLATANGHVNDDRPRFPYAMPAQLLIGGPDGRLSDVTAAAGAPWSVLRVGRGLAVGDLDNDGRIDALMVDQAGPLAYFHNLTENTGHFLTLRLVGGPSNRDAVGAVVTVKADGRVRRAWRAGGGSFLSASDPRIHAGLGASRTAETVEVRWPSGRTDRWENLAADRGYELREGGSSPTPLSGFRPR